MAIAPTDRERRGFLLRRKMPSIAEVFPGATQTATAITIPKSALPTLTPTANNGGDALVVGLLLALVQAYDARSIGPVEPVAPVVVEPVIPFWDYWTAPPTKVWTLSILLRQLGEAPDWKGADQFPQILSTDPPLWGRGGGLDEMALSPYLDLVGRGGGSDALLLSPDLALTGRGGGFDAMVLSAADSEDRTWLIEVTGGDWSIDPAGGLADILLLEV